MLGHLHFSSPCEKNLPCESLVKQISVKYGRISPLVASIDSVSSGFMHVTWHVVKLSDVITWPRVSATFGRYERKKILFPSPCGSMRAGSSCVHDGSMIRVPRARCISFFFSIRVYIIDRCKQPVVFFLCIWGSLRDSYVRIKVFVLDGVVPVGHAYSP